VIPPGNAYTEGENFPTSLLLRRLPKNLAPFTGGTSSHNINLGGSFSYPMQEIFREGGGFKPAVEKFEKQRSVGGLKNKTPPVG